MPRGFNEDEQEFIKESLIDACEKLIIKYGFKKTSVSDICKEVDVSIGTFYKFFENKDVIFILMAERYHRKIVEDVLNYKPKIPTKYDMGEVLKKIFSKYFLDSSFLNLQKDFLTVLKKLSQNFLDKHMQQDSLDIEMVVKLYGLKPKIPMETINAVMHTIFVSAAGDLVGDKYEEAIHLLIDLAVDYIFE